MSTPQTQNLSFQQKIDQLKQAEKLLGSDYSILQPLWQELDQIMRAAFNPLIEQHSQGLLHSYELLEAMNRIYTHR